MRITNENTIKMNLRKLRSVGKIVILYIYLIYIIIYDYFMTSDEDDNTVISICTHN